MIAIILVLEYFNFMKLKELNFIQLMVNILNLLNTFYLLMTI